jgi:hypothetical protein
MCAGPKNVTGAVELLRVRVCVELRFKRLVILALDLHLGLKFFDLQFEASDLGAKLGQVGAHWPGLLGSLWHKLWLTRVLVRIGVSAVNGLRLLRIRRMCWSRWCGVRLKSLSWRIREYWRRCESVRQRARPRVLGRCLHPGIG